MKDYCSNFIHFTGDPQALKEVWWLFRAMSALERITGLGQRPPFLTGDEGLFYNIDFTDSKIYLETESIPKLDLLVQLADRYDVSFSVDYHELGHAVFGEAVYLHGVLNDIRLDVDDFERFTYDMQEQAYVFDGLYYESDVEVLEILLNMKKEQLDRPPGPRR